MVVHAGVIPRNARRALRPSCEELCAHTLADGAVAPVSSAASTPPCAPHCLGGQSAIGKHQWGKFTRCRASGWSAAGAAADEASSE
eukprot:9861345-Alexandrium_andersonii.AAC.1